MLIIRGIPILYSMYLIFLLLIKIIKGIKIEAAAKDPDRYQISIADLKYNIKIHESKHVTTIPNCVCRIKLFLLETWIDFNKSFPIVIEEINVKLSIVDITIDNNDIRNRAFRKSGMTIIPLFLYFNEKGLAKISIGIGKGKKKYDKRAATKSKEWSIKKQRLEKNKEI